MNYKILINSLILSTMLLVGTEVTHAQFLKKLKDQVSKTVTETVDKISSKKKKNTVPKTTTPNKNKNNNPVSTNKNKPAKKQDQEIDYSDVYTIKSPYPEFKSVYLQAHKSLPRFGSLNPYYFKDKYGNQNVNRVKNALLTNGYQNYGNLLTMHYLDAYYKDIDRTILTVLDNNNSDNIKKAHSYIAQKKLLNTAYLLSSESTYKTFFCDVKNNPNCKKNNVIAWGGSRDEFEVQEKYTNFVNSHLDKLLKWSKDFFKDDTQTGYFVNRHKWGTLYDFDAQGYWTPIFPSNSIDLYKGYGYRFASEEAFFFEFLPITKYGNKHLNRMNDPNNYYPLILLKMNAETAETLINKKLQFVYSAAKVKIKFKRLNDSQIYNPNVEFTYHLLNPVIEFFEDIELTKKIGEISLENPIYKSN